MTTSGTFMLPPRQSLSTATAEPADSALAARNDLEAIGAWLLARGSRSGHTHRAYQKEATRFVTYVTYELGLQGLADIRMEHIQWYLDMLKQPPEHWLIKSNQPDQAVLPTRLLKGPLAPRSLAYSRTVINSLYRYLQEAGYILRNPVALTAIPSQPAGNMAERALEPAAWQFLWRWVCEQADTAGTREQLALTNRDRWVVALLYHTGLRRSSILTAVMGDFQRRQGDWTLRVVVKGNRRHDVVVGRHLLEELRRYRLQLGLTPLPFPDDVMPLVGNVRQPFVTVTDRNLGYLFEKMTGKAATACDDPYLAAQIRQLTAHALRHTFATHSLMAGSRLESVQDALGHRSINTTSIYAKATSDMRRQHISQLDRFNDWPDGD